jgi:hypothetical protein
MFLISQRVAISNFFAVARVGGNIGLMSMVTTSGTLVGAILSGMVPGYTLPFVVTGALALLGIPIIILTNPDLSQIPSSEVEMKVA